MIEATAVTPIGRISPDDSGIWSDAHIPSFRRITDFIKAQGAVAGMQIGHAGRKASRDAPWCGGRALDEAEGGWQPVAPSALAFNDNAPIPETMSREAVEETVIAFADAAERAFAAGVQVIEVHAAHGYLLHEFLSPLANKREDDYGGSLANRARFPLEVVRAVRSVWPSNLPLFVRISATDWEEDGWDIEQSIQLAHWLKDAGVDVIDCSSAGLTPSPRIPVGPGYQTGFSERIRREAGIATGAVGMITEPIQAEHIVHSGQADCVLLAREMLRDPYFPLRAARALLVEQGDWPPQYERAFRS